MEQTVIRGETVRSINHYLQQHELGRRKILILMYRSAAKNQEILEMLEQLAMQYQVQKIFFHTELLSMVDLQMIVSEVGASFIPDLILAIGGGSIMDAGKCLCYLYATQIGASDIIEHNQRALTTEIQVFEIPKFLVAPTTAGTGSEATCFAVLYRRQKKYSIEGSFLLPDVVFLLSGLLLNLPFGVQATAMLDAFSQAIESLWSTNSTEESIGYAKKALEEIYDLLPWFENQTVTSSPFTIQRMQEAAYLSGKAINISKTTLAHALSYPLTAHYGIPHGLAVFLNLPLVWEYNCQCSVTDCMEPRGLDHLVSLLDFITSIFQTSSKEAMPEIFRGILRRLHFSTNLKDYFKFEAVENIVAEAASSSRIANNPRQVKGEELIRIYKEHYFNAP